MNSNNPISLSDESTEPTTLITTSNSIFPRNNSTSTDTPKDPPQTPIQPDTTLTPIITDNLNLSQSNSSTLAPPSHKINQIESVASPHNLSPGITSTTSESPEELRVIVTSSSNNHIQEFNAEGFETTKKRYRFESSEAAPPLPTSSRPIQPVQPSLSHTVQDLRTLLKSFLVFIPSSLRRLRFLLPSPLVRITRAIIEMMARTLHKRGALASSLFFDVLVMMWTTIISLFFREIRSRGAWKIPREGEGAIIFVVGPHHNQFLDPLLLLSEVRREAGRRISFLIAAKSMQRRFVGIAAGLMQSIPVARAQDLSTSGTGTISISPDDPTIIVGHDTLFTKEFLPRRQIMLSKSLGTATVEIIEVISDTQLKVKKEFNKKASDGINSKPEGVAFKILPHIDQTAMYSSVYQKLKEGGCIGIFPEGGSHDRTDLLPLKAGVSIMALGALSSNPSLRLRIVPVGLSYFHPHKFRSRAVVEFGSPIEIPREFVDDFEKGGELKKSAIGGMMELVVDGLKSVTVRTPDYETLMLIQATRRLYRPPGQHLTLGQIVELNKRFIAGYEVYKDEPKLKELSSRVKEYNTLLRYMGLKDHQIERVARPLWRSILLLCYRMGLFSVWGLLALPGVILNGPIFVAASVISHMKAREALAASTVKIKGNDVLATWKVMVALAGAPALYSIYAAGATILAFKYDLSTRYKFYAPFATMAGLPLIGYSALKFGEVGADVYKSLRPLFLSVLPGNVKQLDRIRTMRAALQVDIDSVVNELGPQLFDDFQRTRVIQQPAAVPQPSPTRLGLGKRRSSYGPAGIGTLLTHPMSWLDETLFGWGSSPQATSMNASGGDSEATSESGGTKSGYASAYASGYTTEDPDYDEVIHILRENQSEQDTDGGATTPRYRRHSRVRSKSALDLTALDNGLAKSTPLAVPEGSSSAVEDKGLELKKRE